MKYFVSGIGTEIGKTVISAILTEALNADYWKPIQAGDLEQSDSIKVKNLISNENSQIHPESYRLKRPMSPHAAAEKEQLNIDLSSISLPNTLRPLIIEGAGGLLVPLNRKECIIDLIKHLKLEVILVSKHYLGSINHTLLSVEALKSRNIPVKGIIFNGAPNHDTESIILSTTGLEMIARIPTMDIIDKQGIKAMAKNIEL
ncbi:MAG: dethiobiotin synthase [Flavobacteriales bacterium]